MSKLRLDDLLAARGLARDADEARRLIMAGKALVDDRPVDKPGTLTPTTAKLRLRGSPKRFASRAGLKLEAALAHFAVDTTGRVALDLGASTGGFTDCLLQAGAKRVYAVDVGVNQLDYRLRADPRVISLERTHAKRLSRDLIPEPIELLSVDVSFTSLRYVLPPVMPLLAPGAYGLCLFKPQFEAPRTAVRPGGLVAEEDALEAKRLAADWLRDQAITVLGETTSAVKGREGNQEYFFWLRFP